MFDKQKERKRCEHFTSVTSKSTDLNGTLVVDHRGEMGIFGEHGFINFQQAMGPIRRSAPKPAVELADANAQPCSSVTCLRMTCVSHRLPRRGVPVLSFTCFFAVFGGDGKRSG